MNGSKPYHPSDVLEDADGSLLVVDTGGWYVQHCPTGRIRDSRAPGGVYRVRYTKAKAPSDPWGLKENWNQASVQRLIQLLETISQCSLNPLPPLWVEGFARAIESPATRRRAVQTVATLQVPSLDDRLMRLAEDDSEPADLRVEALSVFVRRKPELSNRAFDVLLQQLSAQTNPVARLAASEVLQRSRLTDAQTLGALKAIRMDALISPSALLAAFQESTGAEATAALLANLAELMRGGWRPSRQELENLVVRWPAEARAGAGVLRGLLLERDEQGRARLTRFEPLLAGGNAETGRAVFFANKVACSTCHSIGDVGGKVGPDLTKVAVCSKPLGETQRSGFHWDCAESSLSPRERVGVRGKRM